MHWIFQINFVSEVVQSPRYQNGAWIKSLWWKEAVINGVSFIFEPFLGKTHYCLRLVQINPLLFVLTSCDTF